MKTLIIHTEDDKIVLIKDFLNSIKVKFETKTTSKKDDTSQSEMTKESPYDPEFVAKIERSRLQLKEGKGRIVKIEDLWK